jgi:cobalt-zinc-cadmium efflux system protein
MGHGHSHDQTGATARLGFVLALTAAYMVAELLGGLYSGSLALLADAGHMLTDVLALALALAAARWATRPPTPAAPTATSAPRSWRHSSTAWPWSCCARSC